MNDDTKRPVFFLDADDGLDKRAIGLAANRTTAEANLLAEIQVALDTLEEGADGGAITLVLTRHDMTAAELEASPEE
jgi:hypothetical protein